MRVKRYGDPHFTKRPLYLLPVEERFWAKVDADGDCWLWTAYTKQGYGVFSDENGRLHQAHRWIYQRLVGEIPDGLTLDHLCRVRNCVNPDHLEPVTIGVNTMRGRAISVINAAKTHCANGHPFDADNTYWTVRSTRECKICRRESARKRRKPEANP